MYPAADDDCQSRRSLVARITPTHLGSSGKEEQIAQREEKQMAWQDGLALLAVVWAVAYMLWRVLRRIRRPSGGAGCGGCSGCHDKTRDASRLLIPLEKRRGGNGKGEPRE
jgi:hypothetical protein